VCVFSKAPSLFNEGRRVVLTVYNVTIIAFLLIPVSFLFQEYLPSAVIQTIGIALNLAGAPQICLKYASLLNSLKSLNIHSRIHIHLDPCPVLSAPAHHHSNGGDPVQQLRLHLSLSRRWTEFSLAHR
jgi:hypothetical protein